MIPQAFVDSFPAGILIVDSHLVVLRVNRWLAANLGIEPAAVAGRPLVEAFPELAERGLLGAYEAVFHNRQSLTLSTRLHRYFLRMPAPEGTVFAEMQQTTILIPLQMDESLVGIAAFILDTTGRAQTEHELQREIAKLQALHEIDRAISTLDLQDCLQIIVDSVCAFFGADNAALFLYENEYLRCVADHDLRGPKDGLEFHHNRGVCGWAARSRKSALVNDVLRDERYMAVDARTRAELASPLLSHDDCIGVINVESAHAGAYVYADLELLETIAGRAATAIHNARLHTAERTQRELAETLRDAGLALASELDPDLVLDLLLGHVAKVVPYDSASVMLIESGQVRMKRHYGYDRFGVSHLAGAFDAPVRDLTNLRFMFESRRPNVVADVRGYAGWIGMDISRHIGSWCGAPIIARGEVLGFLSLDKTEPGFYSPELADRLAAFAAQAGLALENARLYAEQQRLAVTDALTGLPNRRRFDEELAREIQRAVRFQRAAALLMIDIDDFKRLNDTYGHPLGDTVLQTLAETLRRSLRTVDTPARYGGEEFAVILPETELDAAVEVGERLRSCISQMRLPIPMASPAPSYPSVTVSIGLAIAPAHADTPGTIIDAADKALYRAKHSGKNRLAVCEE